MSSLPVVPDFPDGLSEERDELSPLVTFDQVRTEKSIYTMILPAAKLLGLRMVWVLCQGKKKKKTFIF